MTCTFDAFPGLSTPGAKPFLAADEGCSEDRDGVGRLAMFLNVISHSTSSPANTVCSVHCTNTLMLDNGVDIVDVRPKLAHPRVKFRYTPGHWRSDEEVWGGTTYRIMNWRNI